MRTIIAGSRDGVAYLDVYRAMQQAAAQGLMPDIIVCGACPGDASADMVGDRWAQQHGICANYHPAAWGKHGRAAGPIRNAKMASVADAAVVVHHGTPGSANMLREARARALPVVEVDLRQGGV
jgi:hypothetical protein